MNEKTAEEKLRQALAGETPDSRKKGRSPQRAVKRAKKISGTAKKTDPFMEDFEKKIEQSLNIGNTFKAPSENQAAKINNKDELGIITMSANRQDTTVEKKEPEKVSKIETLEETSQKAEEIEVNEEPVADDSVLEITDNAPAIEAKPEQEEFSEPEQELPEIPLIEDNIQEDALPDIPIISAENYDDDGEEEVNELENHSPTENFSPSADIVLNVDAEIPHFQEPDPKSEGEAMPVSVVMPETTKTAEDKLMADIAEAMTGSPLTLETYEAPAPYNLPENLSQQSAEDKLMANIAQAMSESPLDIAQNNAAQNLEEEINNLDFVPSFPDHEERLTEEFDFSQYEEDKNEEPEQLTEQEEEEPEKPETEIEATFDESPLPEPVIEPEPESAEELDELGVVDEPKITAIPDNIQDEKEPEELGISDEKSGLADDPVIDVKPELEEEATPFTPDSSPLTDNEPIIDTETYSLKNNSEEQDPPFLPEDTEETQEEKMPEKNLLEEDVNDINTEISEISSESSFEDTDDSMDDFDINSLGELSAAASIMPDYDEPEPEPASDYDYNDNFDSGLETSMPTLNDVIINPEEEKDKEKIMGIREKIAGRKNRMAKETTGDNKKKKLLPSFSGGIFMPLLLILLLAVGGFIAWQLMQLNDKLTSGLMNLGMGAGNFGAMPVETNPSYEYAIDFIFDTSIAGRMAQRGKEGWQVVGSRRTQDSITGQLGYEFIFMRKTPGK